jgi:hypothetical protein
VGAVAAVRDAFSAIAVLDNGLRARDWRGSNDHGGRAKVALTGLGGTLFARDAVIALRSGLTLDTRQRHQRRVAALEFQARRDSGGHHVCGLQ